MPSNLQHRCPAPVLLMDQSLGIRVSQQFSTDDEMFDFGVMVQCLGHKTHAFNVKQAGALSFFARM